MKLFLAALTLLLPAAAAAQARSGALAQPGGAPKPAASVTSGFTYAAPAGLFSGRTEAGGEAAAGRAAGLDLRAALEAAHIRSATGGYFPQELFKTSLNLSGEDRRTRAAVTLNSNSDRPFNSASETDLGFNFTRTFSERGAHAWFAGLSYSSRRSFMRGLPMPFIGYRYVTKDLFFVFPFLIRWQALKTVALSASYQPVKYFRTALAWTPPGPFSAELEGGAALEHFLLAGREDKSVSLYNETRFIGLKPALLLSKQIKACATIGWRFPGRYYTGSSYDDYRAVTRLGAGPVFGLSLSGGF